MNKDAPEGADWYCKTIKYKVDPGTGGIWVDNVNTGLTGNSNEYKDILFS